MANKKSKKTSTKKSSTNSTKAPKQTERKHGKEFLDEAVEKSTYRPRAISRRRATIAGIFAIPFGWSGIHCLMMRSKKRGLLHFAAATVALAMFVFPVMHGIMVVYNCRKGIECVKIDGYDDALNVLVIAGLILFAANVIWGIVEGVIILKNRKFFSEIVA